MPAPWRHRCCGDAAPAVGADADAPDRTGSRPKIARSSSVRPAPTRPAMPRISPRCSAKRRGSRLERLDLQHAPRRVARGPREELGRRRARPSAARSRPAPSSPVAAAHDAAVAQHDDAIADVADLLDEVRDVDDGMALGLQPARSARTAARRRAARGCSSARRAPARGSRRRSRARSRRAAARPPTDRATQAVRFDVGAAELGERSAAASPASASRSTNPNRAGSMPSEMFSATVRSGASDSS